MFKKLKLSTKIMGSFMIVLLLTGVVSYLGWDGMQKVMQRVYRVEETGSIVDCILEARRHEKNFVIRGDPKYVEEVGKFVALPILRRSPG